MILFLKARTPGDDRTMDLFGEPAGSVTASTTRVKGHVRSDGTFVREHMRHVKRARPQVPSLRPIPRGEPGPGQVTMPLAAAPPLVPDAPISGDEARAWVQKVVPEEQQLEVLDRFADMNGTNQMHLFMAWRDVRRDGLQARRERARADFLAHHGPDPVGLEARNPKTDQHAVILPDASAPGRFRASLFDARGFYSHSTRDTPEQILEELIDDGFTEHAPGALDRLASTPEWAEGMEHAWGIQRSNAAPVKQEAPKPPALPETIMVDPPKLPDPPETLHEFLPNMLGHASDKRRFLPSVKYRDWKIEFLYDLARPLKLSEHHAKVFTSLMRSLASANGLSGEDIRLEISNPHRTALLKGANGEATGRRHITIHERLLRDWTNGDSHDPKPLYVLAELIGHEMRHLHQERAGMLTSDGAYRAWLGSSTDDRGVPYDKKQWRNRPWEQDAVKVQGIVAKRAIDDLVGQGLVPVHFSPADEAPAYPNIAKPYAADATNPEITKAMTPLILFFKAQKRGTQGRISDLFGATPPLMETIVPVKGTIDKDGHLRKPHMRRVKVRPEEHSTKVALAPLTDHANGFNTKILRDEGIVAPIIPNLFDAPGEDHVGAGDSPTVPARLGRVVRPENTAEQPYLADGIKLSRGAVTRRPGANQLPEDLAGSLRPHAQDCVNLALEQFQAGYRSFLIADGTGAGKTRQALAIAEMMRRNQPHRPILIVTANRRVIDDAFAKDAATMRVPITAIDTAGQMTGGGIYVTTYTRLGRGDFQGASVGTVMFDEAHNLKNFTSKKTKAGSDLLKGADQSVLLTATPGDKPEHIGYLATAFGFNFQSAMQALGYNKGQYGFELQHGVKIEDALQRLGAFYEDLTAKGLMVKREVSMDNVDVAKRDVVLDDDARLMMAQAHDAILDAVAMAEPRKRGLTKMLGLNRLRNALEPYKINATIAAVQDRIDDGRKVVVFANRINESELPDWWPAGEESSIGTLDALALELEGRGVAVGRLYGKHLNKAGETIAAFQNGTTNVVIATPQAGSTGLNLDDTTGDQPRSMVVMTAPFSSIEAVQMIGRINRLTTKSRADVKFIQADGVGVDAWNFGIIGAKLAHLGASVEGDVAKLDLDRLEHMSDEDLEAIGARNVPVSEGTRIDLATLGLKTRAQREQERQAREAKEAQSRVRTDLRVPYDDKEYAKRYGARWDPVKRTWYVTGEVPEALEKYAGNRDSEAPKPAFVVPEGVVVTHMTQDQIRATQEALSCVAGMCDGARTLDNHGFNSMDASLGRALATALELTPEQAAQGRALVYKYKRQIPESIVERMGKPADGTELDEPAAQAQGAKTAGYKGKRYVIGWQGKTKYGHRTKLVMSDGREFWVDSNRLEKAMILFFKAQSRSAQGRVIDMFGADPPLMDKVVPVKGSVDKSGHVRKPHTRHMKVRPEEAPKPDLGKLRDMRDLLKDMLENNPGSPNRQKWTDKLTEINAQIGDEPKPAAPAAEAPQPVDMTGWSDARKAARALYDEYRDRTNPASATRIPLHQDPRSLGTFKRKVRALAAKTPEDDQHATMLLDALWTKLVGADYNPNVKGLEYASAKPATPKFKVGAPVIGETGDIGRVESINDDGTVNVNFGDYRAYFQTPTKPATDDEFQADKVRRAKEKRAAATRLRKEAAEFNKSVGGEAVRDKRKVITVPARFGGKGVDIIPFTQNKAGAHHEQLLSAAAKLNKEADALDPPKSPPTNVRLQIKTLKSTADPSGGRGRVFTNIPQRTLDAVGWKSVWFMPGVPQKVYAQTNQGDDELIFEGDLGTGAPVIAEINRRLGSANPPAAKPMTINAMQTKLAELGRQYHDHIPLNDIFGYVRSTGYEPVQEDGSPWSGMLMGEDNRVVIPLQRDGKPTKASLTLAWHKMPSGRYEVTPYVSGATAAKQLTKSITLFLRPAEWIL